jgi:hypothetical protein
MPAPIDYVSKPLIKDRILKEQSIFVNHEPKVEDVMYEDATMMYNPYKNILNQQKDTIMKLLEEKKQIEEKKIETVRVKENFKDQCKMNKEHFRTCNSCRLRQKENFDMDGNKDVINVALYGLTGVFFLFILDLVAKK